MNEPYIKAKHCGHMSEPSPFLVSHVLLAQMWEWTNAKPSVFPWGKDSRVYMFIFMNLWVSSMLHFLVCVDQNYLMCSEEEV